MDELQLQALFDGDVRAQRCWPRWRRRNHHRLVAGAVRTHRRPGLGTRVAGHVPADAFRRTHLDRALEPRAARRRRNGRAVVRLDPGLAFGSGHASDHRAVPAAGWTRPAARDELQDRRARFRLRQRHPRAALKLGAASGSASTTIRRRRSPPPTTPNGNGVAVSCPPRTRAPIRWSSPTSSPRRWMRSRHAGRAGRPAAASPCPASSPGRRTNCCNALRPGSTLAVERDGDWVPHRRPARAPAGGHASMRGMINARCPVCADPRRIGAEHCPFCGVSLRNRRAVSSRRRDRTRSRNLDGQRKIPPPTAAAIVAPVDIAEIARNHRDPRAIRHQAPRPEAAAHSCRTNRNARRGVRNADRRPTNPEIRPARRGSRRASMPELRAQTDRPAPRNNAAHRMDRGRRARPCSMLQSVAADFGSPAPPPAVLQRVRRSCVATAAVARTAGIAIAANAT